MPLGTSICLCLFPISSVLSLCSLFLDIHFFSFASVNGENVISAVKTLAR